MRYLALATDYDETIATHGHLRDDVKAALQRLRTVGPPGRTDHGPDLRRSVVGLPDLDLFAAVVLENGAVSTRSLPPRDRCSARQCPISSRASSHAAAYSRSPGPRDPGDATAPRDRRARVDPGSRSGVADRLQRGRGDGASLRREQGQRAAGGAPRAGSVHPRGRRRRKRRRTTTRSWTCASAPWRSPTRSRPSRRRPTSPRRRCRCGCRPIDRRAGRDGPLGTRDGWGGRRRRARRRDGVPATFRPYGQNILVSGPSGAGKSTFATGLIERLIDRDYQICIVDPEGDYGTLDGIVTMGSRFGAPQRRRDPRPVAAMGGRTWS